MSGEILDENEIYAFRLNWAGQDGSPIVCQAATNGEATPLYIITYKTSYAGVVRNRSAGIYFKGPSDPFNNNSEIKYRRLAPVIFESSCINLVSGFTDDMINRASSSQIIGGGIGTPITWSLNSSDKSAVCTSMAATWDEMKGNIRKLLTTAPPGDYWKDIGTSAEDAVISLTAANIILGGSVGAASGGPFGALIGVAGGEVLTLIQTGWGGKNLSSSVQWVLNDSGVQIMGTIYSEALQLQQNIAQLDDGTNGDKWPCTNKELKVFKYDKALEANAVTYPTLNDFASAVAETLKQFEKYKKIIETPSAVGPTNDSSCGGLSGNLLSSGFAGIINTMSCGIAQFLHDTVAWGMTQARELLMNFVGVDIKEKLNFPEVDKTTVSPTGSSGTGTPATGGNNGTTPTTNVSGTFKISSTASATEKNNLINFIAALKTFTGTPSAKIATEKKDSSSNMAWQSALAPANIVVSNVDTSANTFSAAITSSTALNLGTADAVGVVIDFTDSTGTNHRAAFGAPVTNSTISSNFYANRTSESPPSAN